MDNPTSIALSRLVAQDRAVDLVANNLANMSTPGYRAERMVFADYLAAQPGAAPPRGGRTLAYVQDRATYRDATQGTLTHTGNPLDLALSGDGYFTVQTPAGTRLTRAGRFALAPDGTIEDEGGHALLDVNGSPLQLSPGDTGITVAGDGTLSTRNGRVGQIAVVTPADPYKLTAEGNRLLAPGGATAPVTTPKIVQGAVEDSNVQPIAELTRMMSAERGFQWTTQFVEAEGQRRQTAIDAILNQSDFA